MGTVTGRTYTRDQAARFCPVEAAPGRSRPPRHHPRRLHSCMAVTASTGRHHGATWRASSASQGPTSMDVAGQTYSHIVYVPSHSLRCGKRWT